MQKILFMILELFLYPDATITHRLYRFDHSDKNRKDQPVLSERIRLIFWGTQLILLFLLYYFFVGIR